MNKKRIKCYEDGLTRDLCLPRIGDTLTGLLDGGVVSISLREMNIDYMFLLDRLCEDDLIGPLSAPWFFPSER